MVSRGTCTIRFMMWAQTSKNALLFLFQFGTDIMCFVNWAHSVNTEMSQNNIGFILYMYYEVAIEMHQHRRHVLARGISPASAARH